METAIERKAVLHKNAKGRRDRDCHNFLDIDF